MKKRNRASSLPLILIIIVFVCFCYVSSNDTTISFKDANQEQRQEKLINTLDTITCYFDTAIRSILTYFNVPLQPVDNTNTELLKETIDFDTEKIQENLEDIFPQVIPSIEQTTHETLAKATVEDVVDGDTFYAIVNGDETKIRLIGIDTPESVHSDEEKNNEYGNMASEYTKSILSNYEHVYLQYDVEHTDQYGRTLAYVWLQEDVDTTSDLDVQNYMLNAILLEEGYAFNKEYPPNVTYADDFERLKQSAEASNTGLWQYEDFQLLWE